MPVTMTFIQWGTLVQAVSLLGTLSIAVLIVGAAVWVAALGMRGGGLRRPQAVHLTCPMLGHAVEGTIVQDIRTGQWKQILRCSAFEPPEAVTCGRACAAAMNLGLLSPRVDRPGMDALNGQISF